MPTAPGTRSTTWPSGIAAKLVRRHPHVFGDVSVSGADEVKQNWDAIKAAEREAKSGGPGSVLDGVPFGQPALALAAQLQRRAERAGVPGGPGRPGRRRGGRAAEPGRGRAVRARGPGPRGRARPGTGAARGRPRLPRPGPGLGARPAGLRRPLAGPRRPSAAASARPYPGVACVFARAHSARLQYGHVIAASPGVFLSSIDAIHARQILDSRGNPTLEVEVVLDDGIAGPRRGAERGLDRRVRGRRAPGRRRRVRRQGASPGPSRASSTRSSPSCSATTPTTSGWSTRP